MNMNSETDRKSVPPSEDSSSALPVWSTPQVMEISIGQTMADAGSGSDAGQISA